jgi:hypothetical protein
MGDDGHVGQYNCSYQFEGDLDEEGDTSRGRKKGSWLACTYLRHLNVEKAVWNISKTEMRPNMLIL